ncbi:Essential MCU regulator, mitochondrial [Merluccius polli]|uniref:Essential MCU regulator, mitochondrial n=1 Tax=Merluccius polli TaxID=89951 RepID=A0AA47MDF7_MERPO|nr:Essential MCU regulator, mitochondrial [Merluccius polli]
MSHCTPRVQDYLYQPNGRIYALLAGGRCSFWTSLPKMPNTSFGLIRMTIVVVPFLYVGTLISKNFAALLEEHDIFVPEDDDDDD